MASLQQLTGLLEQSGMPNRQWWDEAESAYHAMCQMLTEDINTEELSNRASRPMIVILPTGNYACKLSSRNELLTCVAFGTLRADLFVEVAWQNITRAQDQGSKVKTYNVSEKRSLLSFSGFMFSLHYIESPELVRSFPAIVDVPRAVQAELQAEVDEAVEAIRDVKFISDHTEKYPLFSQIYYTLRAWMISSGMYEIDSGSQSLRRSKKHIACFDGELLRELSWTVILNGENEVGYDDVSAKIADYLVRHESCLQSSTKDDCSFFYDSGGPFARHWSKVQFRVVHEEFSTLSAALTGKASKRFGKPVTDDRLPETLQLLFPRPILQKLPYRSYYRVTMQYSGQSQLAGTTMMQFVEERILDLIQALEDSTEGLHLRPWPTRLVDMNAGKDDHPYEGFWLIGVTVDGVATSTTIQSMLSTWNNKVSASHRFSASTMVIHAELVSQDAIRQQDLKADPRDWPLPPAKPDPRYTAGHTPQTPQPAPTAAAAALSPPASSSTTATTGTTTTSSQHPARKLRPAQDVLSRLKHDASLDLDDYVVGYTDRHAGICEKAAGAWVSESTDEEWIPQGRIQYFRRVSDGVRVWDRGTRFDCVFR